MNVDETKNEKLLMILNHTALAFSFGSMFTDTIKFVFVHDSNSGFPTSKINTELELWKWWVPPPIWKISSNWHDYPSDKVKTRPFDEKSIEYNFVKNKYSFLFDR